MGREGIGGKNKIVKETHRFKGILLEKKKLT